MEELYTKALNYSSESLTKRNFLKLMKSLTETKTIAELSIFRNYFIRDSRRFASALKANQSLTYLNLTENIISEVVATALCQHETLTHLDLSKVKIPDGLLEQIVMTNNLQHLNVSSLMVYVPLQTTDEMKMSYYSNHQRVVRALTISLLTTSTLKYLNVSKTRIDSEDAKELFNALLVNKSLTELDISENKIDSLCISELAEMLKHNKSLTRLNISQNQLTSADLKEIALALLHNQSLTDLNLSLNCVKPCVDSGKALELLLENETLTALNLAGNKLGDHTLRALANQLIKNSTLTKLFLGETISLSVAQDFAFALKHNNTLSSFSLQITGGMEEYTSLGAVIAKEITTSFLTNSVITSLDFSFYSMRSQGAKHVAEFLKHSHTITDLNLRSNFIKTSGFKYIAEALVINKSLLNLNLYHHYSSTEGIVAIWNALKKNRTLVSLDVSFGPRRAFPEIGENELIEVLNCNPVLNSLEVGKCKLNSGTPGKLIQALHRNKTMLNFKVYDYENMRPTPEQILFYTERNRNMLRKTTCIVNYIHNHKREKELILCHISKNDLQEFEEYKGKSALIKSLRQYDFCESEAVKAINYVHFFIKVNFFEIAGIFIDPFCSLPSEISLMVASYLKLKDIRKSFP